MLLLAVSVKNSQNDSINLVLFKIEKKMGENKKVEKI